MSNLLPTRSMHYKGPITDTRRWDSFNHRADDIFICTPPKCGTTWTQAIIAMLVFGKAEHGEKPGVISPWIDATFAPIEDYLSMVDSQTHRRFIKTHTPLDGIPYFPECTYLVVCRDPRDVYFSMLNHIENMTHEDLVKTFKGDDNYSFDGWLNAEFDPLELEMSGLAGNLHFVKSYWQYRDLPNINIFHYADMKADLRSNIVRMAAAIDVEVKSLVLDEMTSAATFENMQRNGDHYAPMAGHGAWKQDKAFFANGNSAQWRNRLSADELAAFDLRAHQLLDNEQIDWLVRS
jgi:aryl sulfotransferase